MRILIISGTISDSEQYKKKVGPLIDLLIKDPKHRIGLIEPGEKTQIEMSDSSIVKYIVDSRGDNKVQIPRFTPKQINDLNNFLSEFSPDLIHSFDEGLLALLTQLWAIRKKIPFLLSIGNIIDKESSLTDKLILKLLSPFGFNERFIGNFYHNSTAIIYDNDVQKEFIEKIEYKGRSIHKKDNDIKDIYNAVIESQKQYIGSKQFSNITKYLPTELLKDSIDDMLPEKRKVLHFSIKNLFWFLAAVIGSVVTYFGIKGRQRLSRKDKDDTDIKP